MSLKTTWILTYDQRSTVRTEHRNLATTLEALLSCTMFPSTISRSVGRAQAVAISRHYSRSVALKAEPKLHNATGKWEQLKSQRPVDEGDLHVSESCVAEIPNSMSKSMLTNLLRFVFVEGFSSTFQSSNHFDLSRSHSFWWIWNYALRCCSPAGTLQDCISSEWTEFTSISFLCYYVLTHNLNQLTSSQYKQGYWK
jgi:hypothetical protein